jgi:serine protease Do
MHHHQHRQGSLQSNSRPWGFVAGLLLATSPVAWSHNLIEQQSKALQRAHEAVLGVQVRAVEDGRTLATLGRERTGSGVLVSDGGLVLTAGFLLLEAEYAELHTHEGRMIPARVVAVDQATGLGLLQALAPLALAPVAIAPARAAAGLRAGEPLLLAKGASSEAPNDTAMARWAGSRPYAANWEYRLDEALFTTPAGPDTAGAGLFTLDGELLGIGAFQVPDIPSGDRLRTPGNLFVPAALLPPLLPELLSGGRSRGSERAWLGLNCIEVEDGVRVMRVTDDSPADVAGLEPGDRIVSLDGRPVRDLHTLWRSLWAEQPAARAVKLTIQRQGRTQDVTVHAVDRAWALRRPEGV